jgi:carbonic anhydrase
MKKFEKILQDNKDWAASEVAADPDYFKRLVSLQSPELLWIGCSDSRVPADKITATQPGEIFVHRNIANMVVHTDVNLLSVLDYAVNIIKVKHVIVCGHYGCGGVRAAMTSQDFKYVLNMWLRNIKDVYHLYKEELDAIDDEEKRTDRLVELNVKEQVTHLAQTSVIQRSWKYNKGPHLHGWVYSLEDGIIRPVFDMPPGTRIDPMYEFEDL